MDGATQTDDYVSIVCLFILVFFFDYTSVFVELDGFIKLHIIELWC